MHQNRVIQNAHMTALGLSSMQIHFFAILRYLPVVVGMSHKDMKRCDIFVCTLLFTHLEKIFNIESINSYILSSLDIPPSLKFGGLPPNP